MPFCARGAVVKRALRVEMPSDVHDMLQTPLQHVVDSVIAVNT